jgi:hypothetical protein
VGQAAQFEARVAIYSTCLRFGHTSSSQEAEILNMLQTFRDNRLGPASHVILALVGELLHEMETVPLQLVTLV